MLGIAVLATVFTILFAFHKAEMPEQAVIDQYKSEGKVVFTEESLENVNNSNIIDALGSDKYFDYIGGNGLYNTMFTILICVIGISALAMMIFWVKNLIRRFMTEKHYWIKFLVVIGVGLIVVGFSIGITLALGNDIPTEFLQKNETSTRVAKLIGMGCWMVYSLGFITIVSILVTEIIKLFKK